MKKIKKIKVVMPRSHKYQIKRKTFIHSKITKHTSMWQDYKYLILNWKLDPLAMIITCLISKNLLMLIKVYLFSMTISYLFITITDLVKRRKKN